MLADAEKKPIAAAASEDGVILEVPAKAADEISTTVVVVLKGKPEFQPFVVKQAKDGSFVITADDAIIHGHEIKVESKDRRTTSVSG